MVTATPPFTLSPLPANPEQPNQHIDPQFGRIVSGLNVSHVAQFDDATKSSLVSLLHTHSLLLFKGNIIPPSAQLAFTALFDPTAVGTYGHSTNKHAQSILHPDLKTIPSVPQVQLIGHGLVKEHEGLVDAKLVHPHHKTFHKTVVSQEDEDKGVTRFYRWHIDAALYDLSPPHATTLHAISVPKSSYQTLRYDDSTPSTLRVPLGSTAFISGAQAFHILPPHLQSLAVRTQITYAPHPYIWMSPTKSNSVGLGLISEGKELALDQLPAFETDKIKTLPAVWKNPTTNALHLQIHPSAVHELHIAPSTSPKPDDIYPAGAHVTDLKEVRDLVYALQRPGIAPEYVYAHDWEEGDFVVFHNRGVLHSVTGAFKEGQVRMFHQCNLASGGDPVGPGVEDVVKFC
ncbi:hypothetical protein HDU98_003307 [Podochytrium sp. JEL0797]|nr:hypothetical protein HDU98_003307 [Podochytrium sp. JEL0797]